MKIVYLAAGAAGMYCGSCLHDNTLAAELIEGGDDVLLVPAYTPLRTDETSVSAPQVVLGGINVFLQQRWPLFRHTPGWLDRWLDSPALLDRLSRRASSTRPEDLGALTVSMLRGEAGHQKKEFDKLTAWLADTVRPDVVHLSNTMLLGVAEGLRRRLQAPIVCSLSGEDSFIEKIPPPHYRQVRELLAEKAQLPEALVSMNHYYARFMADYLGVESDRIHVVPHGLHLASHGPRVAGEDTRPRQVGFLARICPDKGLHQLIEAFCRLAVDPAIPGVKLKVAGYLGPGERPYLHQLEQQLRRAGLSDRYEYVGEVNRDEKIRFLQSLDVMALPTVYRESKGISVLEAWANGVPVVVPDHGTFPELIADTGGGLLFPPGDPVALADALARVLGDPPLARQLGAAGRQAVGDRYHATLMAQRTRGLYAQLLNRW